MFLKSVLMLMLSVFYFNSYAVIQITSQEKPWSQLAPSEDVLVEGSVYILISLNDYVDFAIAPYEVENANLKDDLTQRNCLKYGDFFTFSGPCLKYLSEDYKNVFDSILTEFQTFYDLETPSYKVDLFSSEYALLDNSDVPLRLKTQFNPNELSVDPVSLLSPLVYKALWTVPTNDANCFGTAFAAITPNAALRYRDFLWDTKTPPGYDLFTMQDDLVFGDMIEFEIPGDGHATIYLGTDQDGDEIVLTKNGFMPSVVQVMKYKDVFKLYDSYGITKVNVWRYNQTLSNNYASVNPGYTGDDNPLVYFRTKPPGISVDDFIVRNLGQKFNQWVDRKSAN